MDPSLNEEVNDRYLTEDLLSAPDFDEEEEDGARHSSVRWPKFNERATFKEVTLSTGMLFSNRDMFKRPV